MFDRLPTELLAGVLDKLWERDIYTLCLVSKPVYECAIQHLYEHIRIKVDKNYQIRPECQYLLNQDPSLLQSARKVTIESPHMHGYPSKRSRRFSSSGDCEYIGCAHECKDEQPGGETMFARFGRELAPFLRLFEPGTIREFRWNVGCCLPEEVLGENGVLLQHKTHLSALSLITDPICCQDEDPEPDRRGLSGLPKMTSIRSFSSLRPIVEWDSVSRFMNNNSQNLEVLSSGDDLFWSHGEHDGGEMIRGSEPLRLGALTQLSLRDVEFDVKGTRDILSNVNFGALRRLTLIDCEYTFSLLKAARKSTRKLNLTHLALVMNQYPYHDTGRPVNDDSDWSAWGRILSKFLESFSGLIDLKLLIAYQGDIDDVIGHVDSHRDTLERLILHSRRNPAEWYGDIIVDHDIYWGPSKRLLLAGSKLDFLGLSSGCDNLLKRLRMLKHKPTCRILHLRASREGNEVNSELEEPFSDDPISGSTLDSFIELEQAGAGLHSLAQWAFGPEGLPNLQVIARGDFSQYGRYSKFCELVCRNKPDSGGDTSAQINFRPVTESDFAIHDLVLENLEHLSACQSVDDLHHTNFDPDTEEDFGRYRFLMRGR